MQHLTISFGKNIVDFGSQLRWKEKCTLKFRDTRAIVFPWFCAVVRTLKSIYLVLVFVLAFVVVVVKYIIFPSFVYGRIRLIDHQLRF